jgi:drug/metabolite transporter (DMT)-like permease
LLSGTCSNRDGEPLLTIPQSLKNPTTLGLACGVGAAFCWALGFVVARQGIMAGMSPFVVAMHRYIWPGLVLLPFVARNGFRDLGGIGWGRGFALALFGGLPLALWSYLGFLYVPLGHGGVIQPSSAALGGMLLAWLVLKEPLPLRRIAGGLAIVAGLCTIGVEALRTIGSHGIGGDLLFVLAGGSFATFGMLVRLWRVSAMPSVAITSVLSLVAAPFLLLYTNNILAAGLYENILQAIIQGGLAGAAAIYLFTRAVVLLGASRAVLFPSLVPPFVLSSGFIILGEVPTLSQLAGLVIVVIGFWLTQKGDARPADTPAAQPQ